MKRGDRLMEDLKNTEDKVIENHKVDWLFTEDEYIPPRDRDGYLKKNIDKIIDYLSTLRRDNLKLDTIKFDIDPRVKILINILYLILISLTRNLDLLIFLYIFFICIYVFLLNKQVRGAVLKRVALIGGLNVIILLPTLILSIKGDILFLLLKVIITILIISITGATTRMQNLIETLYFYKIPPVIIWIFQYTIISIHIFLRRCTDIFTALRVRSIGKNKKKFENIINILGNLFFSTSKMSEDMQVAMECRGFDGRFYTGRKPRISRNEYIYMLIFFIATSIYIL